MLNLSIGLNTDNYVFTYSFTDGPEPDVKFGSGKKTAPLFYAVVHEMGHWFGLPHDDYVDNKWPVNIMNNGFLKNKPWCVSEWNLIQLDNAVDQNWSHREKFNAGLKYIEE